MAQPERESPDRPGMPSAGGRTTQPRWQLIVSSVLLVAWVAFLAWMAFRG
jgi:hypothetical protein